jgi:predicted neutral ceramidase superfamily lipid hydrolase
MDIDYAPYTVYILLSEKARKKRNGIMQLKSACFIKRFLMVSLLTVLMASVGTAPDQPVLFIVLSAVGIVLVRFLWKSALRDEKTIRKQQLKLCNDSRKMPHGLKRAA